MQRKRTLAAAALAVALTGALGACGSDDNASDKQTATTMVAATAAIEIDGAWARTSPTGATTGAAYMKLTAADGDVLLGVSVDPSVAKVAELHETVMAGHDMGSGSTMAGHAMSSTTMAAMGTGTTTGAMTMQQVAQIELPKGTTVELKPGGYHIMLMELAKPLTKGSTIVVTLRLQKAGEIDVQVPVLDSAP